MSRMPTSRVAGNSTSGPASSESQTVSVGKRISADTVIAYEQTLGTAETILKLTHKLTRRLSIIGRVGTDKAIDVFYSLTTDNR
jgi:translocation and assembly module TamB